VQLLEQLEPAAHQFLPISETVDPKGRALERRFFLLNILTELSAVDVEHSTVEWRTLPGDTACFLRMKPGPMKDQKLVLRKAIIADHHLWKGSREQLAGYTFCSDLLRAEMNARGLSKLWLEYCEEC
jgi:hypothetical protein